MAAVHVKDDGDLDKCRNGACGKEQLDSEYVIEIVLTLQALIILEFSSVYSLQLFFGFFFFGI